ncbi:sodium/proline symporter PutP [Qipengyuania thermophila]|uniref:sodium/proline symporter PutP n=1 Tax=Qipengyuania thermophila TaxID=2509361 RepID=UPI0028F45BFF|nr:sodium/proline symporter PutP [Qipengyuania thermophila]
MALTLYTAVMLAIGVWASRTAQTGSAGYLLAGRGLRPSVAALSAGASDMSGWLLLGLPGALYAAGLVEAWIAIGLVAGAYVNWLVVAPRLRQQTIAHGDALTIPQFLGNRFPERQTVLRLVSAAVIVVFFTLYTGAGFVGGGKLFETSFAAPAAALGLQPYAAGLGFVALVVVAYTVAGGFLAVSVTDFVQGTIMVLALVAMPLVLLLGDDALARDGLRAVDPGYLDLTGNLTALGLISAVSWGLGYFGQPHIIVRFMTIRSAAEVATARRIGMGWMLLCLLGAIGVGILGRGFVEARGMSLADPETIFIHLAQNLFSPFVAGLLLAALLAAIMSTVSSQLLVAASSLTEDCYRLFLRRPVAEREAVFVSRVAVVLVTVAALLVAADPNSAVLTMVASAWAGFGASFGPVILLTLTWRGMNGAGAVAGLLAGAGTVILWLAAGWNRAIGDGPGLYEIVPGFVAGLLAAMVVSRLTRTTEPRVQPPPGV